MSRMMNNPRDKQRSNGRYSDAYGMHSYGMNNSPKMRKPLGFIIASVMVVVITVIAAVLIAVSSGVFMGTTTAANCVVSEKSVNATGEGSEYRIYTENCGTFVVTDSIVDRRFDSADVYGKIKAGKTYNLTLRGPRIPVVSMFPNIIMIQEVPQP